MALYFEISLSPVYSPAQPEAANLAMQRMHPPAVSMFILMELEFAFNLYHFPTATLIGLVNVLQRIQVEVSLFNSKQRIFSLIEQ